MLTQTCTENLLSDITDICTNIVEDLKADILHKLTSSPVTLLSTIFKEISETFDNEIYRQPFTGLETQYKQLQFYRKFCGKKYNIYKTTVMHPFTMLQTELLSAYQYIGGKPEQAPQIALRKQPGQHVLIIINYLCLY